MSKIDNLKIMKGAMVIIMAGALTTGIVGCSSEEKKEETNNATVEQVVNAYDNTNITEEDSMSEEEIASNTVDEVIDGMIADAEELAVASDEYKLTEAYEETKEQTKENFKEVVDFLFNDGEIAGYTSSEVKEETVEKAEEALNVIDEKIESYIPDYKERAKEKLHSAREYLEEKGTDIASDVYDEYQYLKEKTLEKSYSK